MAHVFPSAVRRLSAVLASRVRRIETGSGLTRAAVLVPMLEAEGGFDLLLTKRTEEVETHKGQIAFPGGVADGEDIDIVHTALRETEEELGITRSSVEIVGLLDDLTTPTGFVITPIVGYLPRTVVPRPNPTEVAEVFTVPLAFFAEERNASRQLRRLPEGEREVWSYFYGGHSIWGATAWIIRSLLPPLAEALGKEL